MKAALLKNEITLVNVSMEPEVLLIGEMIFFFQHERSFLNATKFTLHYNHLLFQIVCFKVIRGSRGKVVAGH